ncbi:hypothetical protein QL285_086929 [Trifolium repens]|nr:hypothetical protein QL285_086929 [Trifolium repens]
MIHQRRYENNLKHQHLKKGLTFARKKKTDLLAIYVCDIATVEVSTTGIQLHQQMRCSSSYCHESSRHGVGNGQ